MHAKQTTTPQPSQFSSVNHILTRLNEKIKNPQNAKSTLKTITRDVFAELKTVFHEHITLEDGSTRMVIVMPNENIVLKIPFEYAGIFQNNNEYDTRNDSATTDVLERHALGVYPNFVSVNPYYQSVDDRAYQLLTETVKTLDKDVTIADYIQIYDYEKIQSEFVDIDAVILTALVDSIENNCPWLDLEDASMTWFTENYTPEFIEESIFEHFEMTHEVDWYDPNIYNFGIDPETNDIILLDAGLPSLEAVKYSNSDMQVLTCKELLTGNLLGTPHKLKKINHSPSKK